VMKPVAVRNHVGTYEPAAGAAPRTTSNAGQRKSARHDSTRPIQQVTALRNASDGRGGRAWRSLARPSPNLNAFAERFVRSIKSECLDRMIFFGQASLQHAVSHFMAHYHIERNHQGLANRLLQSGGPIADPAQPVQRRQRLGGMLNYYFRAAAWLPSILLSGQYGMSKSVTAAAASKRKCRVSATLRERRCPLVTHCVGWSLSSPVGSGGQPVVSFRGDSPACGLECVWRRQLPAVEKSAVRVR
jgi:hypothetical protein